MARITPLSGFPEWLPEQNLLQQRIFEHLKGQFELHGYEPLTTRAVEPLDVLLSKGADTDKEIYVLRRLNAEDDQSDSGMGLHFDLTVPFARYVQEHRGDLFFPWRRYQIQSVWRGERPQQGRYREFVQADIDVIGQDTLPIRCDAEVVALVRDVMVSMPIPPVRLMVNNRKLLEGLYRGLGVTEVSAVLQAVDKRAKIGVAGVSKLLSEQGLSDQVVETIVAVGEIETSDVDELREAVSQLGVCHPLVDEGLDELSMVLAHCTRSAQDDIVVAALHIARGLDYYTGTVMEGFLVGHEHIGSVCAGGRYDNLSSSMAGGPKLPGVGASIGLTRILGYLFGEGLLVCKTRSPSQVLIMLPSEDDRGQCESIAETLRSRGICCEVYHRRAGWGKQMKQAARKGIRYVWFPATDGPHVVKDLQTGSQSEVSPSEWQPETMGDQLPLEVSGEAMMWP